MTYLADRDFLIEVKKGNVAGHSVVNKFGKNGSVGTAFVPVTIGGIYRTPQVAGATTLRIKSGGDANDTAAGSGARQVTLEGLDASGDALTQTVATAGASASSATATAFLRLHRFYVSESGTYATQSTGSHVGDIVIEDSGGTQDWGTISSTDFPRGQSEVAAYSVPDGYNGYIIRAEAFSDSTKTTTILGFQRTSILQTSAPYDAMRMLFELRMEGGEATIPLDGSIEIVGPADVGFMAKVNTGTAEVDVDFEFLLVAQ